MHIHCKLIITIKILADHRSWTVRMTHHQHDGPETLPYLTSRHQNAQQAHLETVPTGIPAPCPNSSACIKALYTVETILFHSWQNNEVQSGIGYCLKYTVVRPSACSGTECQTKLKKQWLRQTETTSKRAGRTSRTTLIYRITTARVWTLIKLWSAHLKGLKFTVGATGTSGTTIKLGSTVPHDVTILYNDRERMGIGVELLERESGISAMNQIYNAITVSSE